MYLTTRGLVLRTTEYKETDRILTILTDHDGLLSVKARGVRSNRSKLKGACQLLTYAEFTISDARGFTAITEATAIEMFPELRNDLLLLSLASYFAQLAEVLSQEDASSPALLSLILNALYALSKLKKPPRLVKAATELRLAAIAGYMPELSGCCVRQGRPGPLFPSPTGRWNAPAAARPTGCGCRCLRRRWRRCGTSSPARIRSSFPSRSRALRKRSCATRRRAIC